MLASFLASAAAAQTYPDRPVRILVGYPPGGGTDLVARLVAQPLGERWGQPVIVENRPGAAAIIATEAVAKAKPDGYTLLMAYATELAVNPATFKKLPYDPVRDLAPIARLGSAPLVMAVHPSLPAQTVAELVALAKAKPGALSYSSSGHGQRAPVRRRAVQAAHRRRHRARALQGLRAGDGRRGVGPGAGHLRLGGLACCASCRAAGCARSRSPRRSARRSCRRCRP